MFEGTTCNAGKLCLSDFLVEINLKIFFFNSRTVVSLVTVAC